MNSERFSRVTARRACNLHLALALVAVVLMAVTSLNTSKVLARAYFAPLARTDPEAKAREIDALARLLSQRHEDASNGKTSQCEQSIDEADKTELVRMNAAIADADVSKLLAVQRVRQCTADVEADCEAKRLGEAERKKNQTDQIEANANERNAWFRMQEFLVEDDDAAKQTIAKRLSGPWKNEGISYTNNFVRDGVANWAKDVSMLVSHMNLEVKQRASPLAQVMDFCRRVGPACTATMPAISEVFDALVLPALPAFPDLNVELKTATAPALARVATLRQRMLDKFPAAQRAAEAATAAAKSAAQTANAAMQPKTSTKPPARAEDWTNKAIDVPWIAVQSVKQEHAPDFESASLVKQFALVMAALGSGFLLQADVALRVVRIGGIAWKHWRQTSTDPRPVDARAVIHRRHKLHFVDNVVQFTMVVAVYVFILGALCLGAFTMYRPFYHDYRDGCVLSRNGTMEAQNAISVALLKANVRVNQVSATNTFTVETKARGICANGSNLANNWIRAAQREFQFEQNQLSTTPQCSADATCIHASNVWQLAWEPPKQQVSYRCQQLLQQCDLNVPLPSRQELTVPVIDAFCQVESDFHSDVKVSFFAVFLYYVLNVLRVSLNYSLYLLTLEARRAETTDMVWDADAQTGEPRQYHAKAWRLYLHWLNSRNLCAGLFMLALAIVSASVAVATGSNFDLVLEFGVQHIVI